MSDDVAAAGVRVVDAPVWFTRRPLDHRPALLQLPAARHWFEADDDDVGCWDAGVAWIPIGDRIVAVPLDGPPDVLAPGVVRGPDGTLVDARDGRLAIVRGARRGLDRATTRGPSGWACDGVTLPEGAVRATLLEPFARGDGLLWADQGWLYRRRGDEAVRAVGPFRTGERLSAGPDGALLVGDGEVWHRVAGPRAPMHRLRVPLDAHGPVRFSRTGRRCAGVDGHGDAVVVDTATGEVLARRPGALPLTDRAFVEPGAPDVPGEALLASPVVAHGDRLAGPGGRLWDLDAAEPVDGASLGPGPHAGCGARWATWDGEGALRWIDARTGDDLVEVPVALQPGEVVVGAWAAGRTCVLATSAGRRLGLGPRAATALASGEPPPPSGVPCPALRARLGFERQLAHGGRTVAWSSRGLLAVFGDDPRGEG